MMTIKFKTDSDAFGDTREGRVAEVAFVLGKIAEQLADGTVFAPVLDSNGNSIGHWLFDRGHEGNAS